MKNSRYAKCINHALVLIVFLLGYPYLGYADEIKIKNADLFYIIDTYSKEASCSGNSEESIEIADVKSSIYYDGTLYTVTSIGYDAFQDCTSLTSITIPNSVTSIGSCAFWDCTSLTSITIPNSVTSISENTFCGCTSLTSITIPNSVVRLGFGAFQSCTSLTSITIPNSVTSIGSYAFRNCTSLTSITIPNSVTSIGSYAFQSCTSLTSITIPNSVTSISENTFCGCTSLNSITIPNSVVWLGSCAFENCTSLTSITIPSSVTSIGYGAFRDCTSLTSIAIPNSVTSVGYYAFSGCSIYYLTGEYEQSATLFPNLLFRDNGKNHKRLWDGAKIIKTSLTDSLELTNYLSGLTISYPQVLIVPTGCYRYVVDTAKKIKGLSVIEDHNMQFSLTSWEDDLWKLAQDSYTKLKEIPQLSFFTSLNEEDQDSIRKIIQDCAALQRERVDDGDMSRYNITYPSLCYNENFCQMLQILDPAQKLMEWDEIQYIEDNLYSDFDLAYHNAFRIIKEEPLAISNQEIEKLQVSYDAALAACNGIRKFYDELSDLIKLADTLKAKEWYANVPESQKSSFDQAIEAAQTVVDEREYDASLQSVMTSLQDAYNAVLKNRLQQQVSMVEAYIENDIANIRSFLDGYNAVNDVMTQAKSELDTNNFSNMLQITDTLQVAYSNIKTEAEKYVAELQTAKQTANQLIAEANTLKNETYKDIYAYIDADTRSALDDAMKSTQQMVATYDKSAIVSVTDTLQTAYDHAKLKTETYISDLQTAKTALQAEIDKAGQITDDAHIDLFKYLDEEVQNNYSQVLQNAKNYKEGFSLADVISAKDDVSEMCDSIWKMYDRINAMFAQKTSLIQQISELDEKYPYSYEALDADCKAQLNEAVQNAQQNLTTAQLKEAVQQMQTLYDSTLVLIGALRVNENIGYLRSVCDRIDGLYDQAQKARDNFSEFISQSNCTGSDYYAGSDNVPFYSISGGDYSMRNLLKNSNSGWSLNEGDYVDVELNGVNCNAILALASNFEARFKIYYSEGYYGDRHYLKECELTGASGIYQASIDLGNYPEIANYTNSVIRIEYAGGSTSSDNCSLRLFRRDDLLLDDEDVQKCDSLRYLFRLQVEHNDVQNSHYAEIDRLCEHIDYYTSRNFDFSEQTYKPYVCNGYQESVIPGGVKTYVICSNASDNGRICRRTYYETSGCYILPSNVPVILHGPIGCYMNYNRISRDATILETIDTIGSMLKISDGAKSMSSGYIFNNGTFDYYDSYGYIPEGVAYIEGCVNDGSLDIDSVEEFSPIVTSASAVKGGSKELKVYDLNGRYIPVKDLNELPAGIYIVNGRKTVLK